MGTSRSFAEAGAKLDRALSPATLRKMTMAGGLAAKDAAHKAAEKALGGDRQFSGFARKATLSAGFDVTGPTQVTVKFRPPGLWALADRGRQRTKKVRAGRGRGRARRAAAFRTPEGPRASFASGPSRGKGALRNAQRIARREVPKAAHKALRRELGSVF